MILGAAAGGRKGSLAVKAGLLGAKSLEDMYLRSEIGEGFHIVRKDRRANCQTIMDTYPAGLLTEPLHNLMLMDLPQQRRRHEEDPAGRSVSICAP